MEGVATCRWLIQPDDARYPSRKSRSKRKKKISILIVCEGLETERHYFDLLKRDDRVAEKFAVTIKKGKGGSREQIANHAIERKNESGEEHDETWCVMDVEHQLHKESLEKALKLLKENGIKPCLSNPSFEVWFLAHFERTARMFKNCNAVIVRLNQHWNKRFNSNYQKSDTTVYRRISDLTATAISNAQKVRQYDHGTGKHTKECNSSTFMHELVRYLLEGIDPTPE